MLPTLFSACTLRSHAVTEMPHFFLLFLSRLAPSTCATSPLMVSVLHISQLSPILSSPLSLSEVPLLRKAVINLHDLNERDVSVVARLLNCVEHVEELSLHIKESEYARYPIPILSELEKHVPHFSNLKHLDLILCFHKWNIEAVTTILHNCPVLESLKLVHEERQGNVGNQSCRVMLMVITAMLISEISI
ncbi:uncharacterized protein LOC144545772 isoform X3 [Carex rostrata]